MSRLVAEHFNNTGQPKRAYSSEAEAIEDAQRYHKKIYLCKVCGQYHLGGHRNWGQEKKLAPWMGDPEAILRCRNSQWYKNSNAAAQAAHARKNKAQPYQCSVKGCDGWHLLEED